jgi:N-acetylneuraminate lyase
MNRLEGLIAATFTPMHDDGRVNLTGIRSMVERLIASGVNGLYVNGSTGQGPSLTTSERRATAERFIEMAAGRLPVVVQVGHESVAEAVALAHHAVSIGADAISAVPPTYYPIDSMQTLTETIAPIAEASMDRPFYYYHIPRLSGVDLSMVDWLQSLGDRIPNLAGVKFTATDTDDFARCLQVTEGRFELLWGVDEMLLEGLRAGAKGAIGSTYNFAAPLYQKLIDAYERADQEQAQVLQDQACKMVDVIAEHGGLGVQKTMMALAGAACGPSRWPVRTLGSDEEHDVQLKLEAIGFFEFCGAEAGT